MEVIIFYMYKTFVGNKVSLMFFCCSFTICTLLKISCRHVSCFELKPLKKNLDIDYSKGYNEINSSN